MHHTLKKHDENSFHASVALSCKLAMEKDLSHLKGPEKKLMQENYTVFGEIIHKVFARELDDTRNEMHTIPMDQLKAIIESNPNIVKYFFQSPFVRDILEDTVMVKNCILSSPLTAHICSLNPSFRDFIEQEENIKTMISILQNSESYEDLENTRKTIHQLMENAIGEKLVLTPSLFIPPSPSSFSLLTDMHKQVQLFCNSCISSTSTTADFPSNSDDSNAVECKTRNTENTMSHSSYSYHSTASRSSSVHPSSSVKVHDKPVASLSLCNPWAESRRSGKKIESPRHHYRKGNYTFLEVLMQ